ncbi:MAG: hypothetical protein GY710_21610 [Desulfobacteraceae bacterium]|nr:hypothetical protein [Desulfobacteraceae bacterium]
MAELEIKKLSDKKNTLSYIGSVNYVIKGVVPDKLKNKRFSASKVQYGFELASPQGIYNMGECILLNDILYSSRTDQTRNERDPLMWGPEFVTSGIFLIPKEAQVNYTADYCSIDDYISMNTLYRMLYEKIDSPFTVVGCAELSYLRGGAISYAPIKEENIFDNRDKYYREEDFLDNNVNIAFMGVVSDMKSDKYKKIKDKLDTVLYYNPFNKQTGKLITHTHALLLNRAIVDIEKISPHHATHVLHLMDDSMIRYTRLKIFKINDMVEYKED